MAAGLFACLFFPSAIGASSRRPLAPGCLSDGTRGLADYRVSFRGLAPSESVVKFYDVLQRAGVLPCRPVTLDESQPTPSHSLMMPPKRAVPPPYPAAMDDVLCRLNTCRNGRLTGKTFVAPDVDLEPHFPTWTQVSLDRHDDPARDVEAVLKAHHVPAPWSRTDEREAWLEKIRIANDDFKVPFTRPVQKSTGEDAKQRYMVVPATSYHSVVRLPRAFVAANPPSKWDIPDFTLVPVAAGQSSMPETRGGASDTPPSSPLAARFTAALHMISMPSALPFGPGAGTSLVIADRGIDTDCAFLHPGQPISADALNAAIGNDAPCTALKHGTHVWGIIAGFIPQIMRGIAADGAASPTIKSYDFNTHPAGQPPSFIEFVNENFPGAKIANLSVDFGANLPPELMDAFDDLIDSTRSMLYVAAADDAFKRYKYDSGSLGVPLRFYRRDNVLVVTALDETGTNVWAHAARNRSENDDVVLLAAPGVGIPSACGCDHVGMLDGTSQATAFVSGAAALLVRDGLKQALLVKRRLAYTADVLPTLADAVGAGRLNVSRALGVGKDKLCPFAIGDGIECQGDWTTGDAMLGYGTAGDFVPATRIVVKGPSGQKLADVNESNLLRVSRTPGPEQSFSVFSLEPDPRGSDALVRSLRVSTLEAFSDADHHGPLVIRYLSADGTPLDTTLGSLGDFVRKAT